MQPLNNDIEVLEQLKTGSLQAFDHFYESYRHWLLLSAIAILRDEEEAKELVQDFFIDFWRKEIYRNITCATPAALKNFMFISVKNRCLNKIARDETRRKRLSNILLPEGYILPSNKLENTELYKQLETAMSQLPPRQLQAFRLAYLEQKTRKEIAAEMGVAEETVKMQIASALKNLRASLKKIAAL